jgi:enoyl-CoA hydratase/carnithine racemase
MTSEAKAAKPPVIGRVTTERQGHIFLMGLDRTPKLNSFDVPMMNALAEAFGEYERDDSLWCAVLFGHGDHFTSGLDLTQHVGRLAEGTDSGYPEGSIDPFGLVGPRVSKPVVCAVQGYCYTAGIEIMLATDIHIAAENTRFAQIEIKRGIYPSGGATIRMVQQAGWGNAMRYLLTGDEFSAQEAYRIGLVQEIVPVGQQLERAIQIANVIAAQAPLGVKATLKSARLAVTDGQEAAIRRLRPDQMELMKTADAKEGVQSFIERRAGNWQGR